jgi:hypothetical protein
MSCADSKVVPPEEVSLLRHLRVSQPEMPLDGSDWTSSLKYPSRKLTPSLGVLHGLDLYVSSIEPIVIVIIVTIVSRKAAVILRFGWRLHSWESVR